MTRAELDYFLFVYLPFRFAGKNKGNEDRHTVLVRIRMHNSASLSVEEKCKIHITVYYLSPLDKKNFRRI